MVCKKTQAKQAKLSTTTVHTMTLKLLAADAKVVQTSCCPICI